MATPELPPVTGSGLSSTRRIWSLVWQYAALTALSLLVLGPILLTIIQASGSPFTWAATGKPLHPVHVEWKDRTWLTGGAASVIVRTAVVLAVLLATWMAANVFRHRPALSRPTSRKPGPMSVGLTNSVRPANGPSACSTATAGLASLQGASAVPRVAITRPAHAAPTIATAHSPLRPRPAVRQRRGPLVPSAGELSAGVPWSRARTAPASRTATVGESSRHRAAAPSRRDGGHLRAAAAPTNVKRPASPAMAKSPARILYFTHDIAFSCAVAILRVNRMKGKHPWHFEQTKRHRTATSGRDGL